MGSPDWRNTRGSATFLDVILEVTVAGLDSATGLLRSAFRFYRLVAEKLSGNFPDLASCLTDSTFELVPIHATSEQSDSRHRSGGDSKDPTSRIKYRRGSACDLFGTAHARLALQHYYLHVFASLPTGAATFR